MDITKTVLALQSLQQMVTGGTTAIIYHPRVPGLTLSIKTTISGTYFMASFTDHNLPAGPQLIGISVSSTKQRMQVTTQQ
jgi:hypothetical protein